MTSKPAKFTADEFQAIAAFATSGIDFYQSGTRMDEDGWWAVVWRWVGSGTPADEVKKHGPFKTEADARAEAESWGKDKAGVLNIFNSR